VIVVIFELFVVHLAKNFKNIDEFTIKYIFYKRILKNGKNLPQKKPTTLGSEHVS
jgi:hypothetical protein